MGTKVTYKLAQSDKFNGTGDKSTFKPPYIQGQLVYVIDMDTTVDPPVETNHGKIYVDFHDRRICFTPTTTAPSSGMHFIGISKTDPTQAPSDGTLVLTDESTVTPNEHDMVGWGKKEYLWRRDAEDGTFKWLEIGDEEEMDWNF